MPFVTADYLYSSCFNEPIRLNLFLFHCNNLCFSGPICHKKQKTIRTEARTRDLSRVRRASWPTRPCEQSCGVSGFRSQYLVLAKDARFQLRQYPCTTPRGFEPLRSKTTHLAGEPLNHSGKVSCCLHNHRCPTLLSVYGLEKHKKTNTLHVRGANTGCLCDWQK